MIQPNQIIRFSREVFASRFCRLILCLFFLPIGQQYLYAEQASALMEQAIAKHFQEADKHLSAQPDSLYWHINAAAQIARQHHLSDKYTFEIAQYKIACANRHFHTDSMYYFLKNADTRLRQLSDSLQNEIELFLLKKWRDYHYKIGNWSETLRKTEALHRVLENDVESKRGACKSFITNLVYKGSVEIKKGNYDLGIEHLRYAFKYVETMKKLGGNDYTNRLNLHLAGAYKSKGEYIKAIAYYLKANESYRRKIVENPKLKNSLLNNYNNIAKLYLEQNKPDSALHYLNESLQYHLSEDQFYATTWLNIGKAHKQKGSYTKAADYMNQALAINQNRYGEKHYKTAEVQLEIGNIFQEKQDFENALTYYQRALVSLFDEYNDASIHSLPSNQNTNNKKELLLALQSKANAFHALYLKDKNIENLEHANAHIQLTISVMDEMRCEYSSEEARQFLVEKSYPIFEKAIEINRQLYLEKEDKNYLSQAFQMTEKSKSLSLLDALKNADAQQFADIPEHTLEQERQLRVQMNHLKGKISKLKKETKNENTLRQFQNKLFEQQQQYYDFVKTLETDYPYYYSLKYDQDIAGVNDIRRDMLSNDAVFVEYFMGDEQLYAFFISKNNIHISARPNTEPIQVNAAALRQAITEKNDTSYIRSAYFLYQNLLQEGLEKIGTDAQRLIIVPDGVLAYIPFDILLKNKVEHKENLSYRNDIMPYLINSYAVSYAYSATVLQQNLSVKKGDNIEHNFAGFAPNFTHTNNSAITLRSCHDDRLVKLPYSQHEINAIHQLIGGTTFTETNASKVNFINLAGKSRLIHLSTHACADENDQLSRIYFNDEEYLTALELYALRLRADMVVLSACETGIGKLQRGEGVMSLARAFAYTGVPATTMSLWSVDDKATSQIMVHYYEHLKSGQTKDEALRNAKLDFLKNVEETRHQHPYYWAAFVHIGNADALSQGSNWWLGLLALALLIGFVGIRQFYHKK